MTPLRTALGTLVVASVLLGWTGPVEAVVDRAGERSVPASVPSLRSDWQERMLTRVNALRAEAGARPLRMCPALTRSADAYAREMSRDNTFSHTGTDGSTAQQRVAVAGYRPSSVGENLAAGQPTVAAAIRGWRESPSHYATMTDPRFRHVGFGFAPGRGVPYATFWVQHFGAGGSCR
jgi:uncharacterized protein YkwD